MKLAHRGIGGDPEKDGTGTGSCRRPSFCDSSIDSCSPNSRRAEGARADLQIPMAHIYVGVGRLAGLLPQHLVGAVTGGGIKGNLLGAIEICDKYSLVEIPEQFSTKWSGRCRTR